MVQPSAKAKIIIDAIKYAALATVSKDGEPWNTPLAIYHFHNDYILYWASWHSNQHSQNIRANGKAFVAVYDSTPANGQPTAGVYLAGRACEITDQQEAMQVALVFGDDPYNPSDGQKYLGDHPRRLYKFVPDKVWMNDGADVDGNFIDVRKKAEM